MYPILYYQAVAAIMATHGTQAGDDDTTGATSASTRSQAGDDPTAQTKKRPKKGKAQRNEASIV